MEAETSSKRRKQNQEIDWISSLPDTLIHQILLLLDTKSAARTSTLSKRWSSLWSNFQIVDLNDDERWNTYEPPEIRRPKFMECLQLTVERRTLLDLSMMRIKLQRFYGRDMDPLLDELIVRAVSGNLRTLVLDFEGTIHFIPKGISQCNACFMLPDIIFNSGLHLEVLNVNGCQFRAFYSGINLGALTTLILEMVHIRDDVLMELIAHCPLIESLTIKDCWDLKVIRVVNPKLKYVSIEGGQILEWLEMDLPNMKSCNLMFWAIEGFGRYNNNNDRTTKKNNGCLSLTTLHLSCLTFTVEIFELILSSFPNLEIMILRDCEFTGRPKLIASKLRYLKFNKCIFEEEIDIFSPNIEFMGYVRHSRYLPSQVFHPPKAIRMFQRLTTIILEGKIKVSDESIKYIVDNFKALKNLTLIRCTGFKELKISSLSLEKLVVEECKDLEKANINAPALVYFKYIGPILWLSGIVASDELHVEFFLISFSNYHRINCFSLPFDGLESILWNFYQARVITLDCDFQEYYGPKRVSTSTPLYFLKNLVIKTSLNTGYIDVLYGLFEYSFCCGILVIDVEESSIKLKFQEEPAEEVDDETGIPFSRRYNHNCVRDHLFEVEMDNFEGKEKEIELVRFLLDKANNLKTMSISFNEKTYQENRASCLKMMHAVKSFSKTSPTAKVIYS